MNVLKHTKALFCAAGFLVTSLIAGCGGGSDAGRDPILGLPNAALVSVVVTPANPTIVVGATQQYVATANFADGTSRDVTTMSTWTSGNATAATIGGSTGLATGRAGGTSAITATYSTAAGSTNLIVNVPPPLAALTVTPATATIARDATQQYVATARFTDNTTAILTTTVTWSSSVPTVATVAATGRATGVAAGTTQIRATSGTIVGTSALTVQ